MMKFNFTNLGLDRWFDFDLIVADDDSVASKPEPDVYLAACKKLELKPYECLVFEDSEAGISSAYKAGVRQIVAITKYAYKKLGRFPGVVLTVNDFTDFNLKSNIFGAKIENDTISS